ncbi:MAG TPA: hypothetical protein VF306_07985 [Pirellulales bacterium]
MKTHVCLLALAVCWGPTFCLAGSDEPADSAAGGTATNRAAFAAVSSRRQAAPSGRPENNWRYRNENGRWWYWSSDNRWSYFNGSRWTPYTGRERGLTPPRALAGQGGAGQDGAVGQEGGVNGEAPLGRAPFGRGMQGGRASGLPTGGVGGQDFGTWFNAYRGFQTGSGALRTAEQGGVEMGTADISAEAPATEVFEFGGIPGRQVRRPSPIGRTMKGSGAWFSSGSPFGIKFGYGSGFGYGGYGFDNPYGYGSRSGGGGAYGYGFGPFGSVGGQTGERLSSLISGGAEPSLIGPEPPGMGAPSRLESAVGGQYGKAGAGVRKLGAGAGGGIGSGSGGAGD